MHHPSNLLPSNLLPSNLLPFNLMCKLVYPPGNHMTNHMRSPGISEGSLLVTMSACNACTYTLCSYYIGAVAIAIFFFFVIFVQLILILGLLQSIQAGLQMTNTRCVAWKQDSNFLLFTQNHWL